MLMTWSVKFLRAWLETLFKKVGFVERESFGTGSNSEPASPNCYDLFKRPSVVGLQIYKCFRYRGEEHGAMTDPLV
ncbi:hypothetical protein KC320_g28 [Hortaea werneckii]|nr:hypothetical protein KC320_g28 [Hortaea werneckii]